MNKGLFSGWNHVFSFTFKQGVSGKGFKMVTLGLAVALFLIGGAISVIMAVMQKKDATEVSPIEKVYVVDESGLEVLYLDGFMESFEEKYSKLFFATDAESVEEANAACQQKTSGGGQELYDVILHIGRSDAGYTMTLYLPEQSLIEKDEGEEFLEDVVIVMEQSKLFSSGIAMEKLVLAVSGISTTMLDAGEQEKSFGEELVSLLLPMILIFFMYMMFLLYGQSIGNIVSVEKTSKLMEMILTLTRPYGLIFGKVFAMTVIAILQLVAWMVCFVIGFVLGDMPAKQLIYPKYNNVVLEALKLLESQEGSTAFSVEAVVMAIVIICLAFLFYSMIAGLVASFATKAEELGQMMAYYQLIMVAGFFGAYMGPLQEKEWLNTLLRIVPVTSAYLLPGDIMVGNVTVLQGALYAGILLITTLVLAVVTGKVYKNQLFYRGRSLKERLQRKKG